MSRLLPTDRGDLTEWFPASLPPYREGVYLRQYPAGPYSCWSGVRWYADEATPAAAAAQREPSRHQNVPWRGLTTAPAEPCWACRGHTVVDHGVDAETGADLISECAEC